MWCPWGNAAANDPDSPTIPNILSSPPVCVPIIPQISTIGDTIWHAKISKEKKYPSIKMFCLCQWWTIQKANCPSIQNITHPQFVHQTQRCLQPTSSFLYSLNNSSHSVDISVTATLIVTNCLRRFSCDAPELTNKIFNEIPRFGHEPAKNQKQRKTTKMHTLFDFGTSVTRNETEHSLSMRIAN